MAKQLNVNLGFTADTSQARAQLQALQKSLRDLTHSTTLNTPSFQLTEDLHEATTAAAQLSVQLKNATNVNTGNLDLTKFSESMRASGMSLEKYQNQLYQLGPAGEKAFADLARSITLAEVPLKRSSKLLDNLWTTMKNTARWQLTSSAMHGFMGAVSSAYGYVQDLNESLNNIRIVTGYSADKMAEFAVEANKAAKALSTTTTEYANASLIYYQQGLSDTAVKERTDITVKMANVSRQSAETVSEQLTAIWNNFDDGTQSLEYYVDVITALGAATASSSEEISDGLEKFAAVAETVGLSYEYATAALATVTATTRQSADVVGTAFKTLFARLNDLKLGETLDDGTTLGQYTENLARIGVNIKDASGQLKDMDIILNETAAKWGDLDKAQQVALAKGVAGIRQYTQFIALMDNWDFMQENLKTVEASGGTLQQQADIYADSWEAANKKVKASAQSVYEALLNDDFFIDLTNGFSKLLDGVKSFIDGLGGVRGVLLAIGSIVTRVFSKQIGASLSNVAFTLKGVFNPKKAQADAEAQKMQANELLIQGAKDIGTTSSGYSAEAYAALGKNQLSYIQNAEKMSQEEQAINQILMDRNRQLADEVIAAGRVVEQVEERIKKERSSLQIQAQLKAQAKGTDYKQSLKALTGQQKAYEKLTKSSATFINLAGRANLSKHLKPGTKEAISLTKELKNVVATTANISTSGAKIDSYDNAIKKLSKNLGIGKRDAKALWNELSNADNANINTLTNQFTGLSVSTEKAAMSVRKSIITSLKECGFSANEAEQQMKEYDAAIDQWGPSSEQAAEALRKLNVTIDQHNGKMQEATLKPIPMGQALSTAASGVMALGQAFTTVTGIIDVFNNEEATTTEKITALISGVGMLIPAIMSITQAFSTVPVGAKAAQAAMVETGAVAQATGTTISLAMWQVTLIVAAVTALVGVIAIIATSETKAEKAAKKATKAAENLADSAEEAKQELEDLKSAFDTYDSAVKALNACTKGTKEWDDALKNVNKTVLDIIKTNPQLLGQGNILQRNAQGMLEINPEKREEILNAAEQNVTITGMSALFGSVNAKKSSNQVALNDLADKIEKIENDILRTDRDYLNASFYSSGTGVNFADMLSKNLQSLADLKPEEFKSKLRQIIMDQSSFYEKNDDLYIQFVDEFIESSLQHQDALNTLSESTMAVSQAMIDASRLIIDERLQDQYSGEEKDIAAIKMAQQQEKYETAYLNLMTSTDWFFGAGSGEAKKTASDIGYTGSEYGISKTSGADNEIYKFLAQEMEKYGLGYHAARGNVVQGSDANREFVFLDDSGKKVQLNAEAWAQMLASAKALQELGQSAEEARKTLTNLSNNVSQGEASAITGLITQGNLYNLTGESRTKILNAGINVDSQEDVLKYLKTATGVQSDEALARLFNVDTIDQVFEKWQKAWGSSEIAFDDIKSGWVKPIQDWYDTNSKHLQQFTAAGQSEILQSLTEAFHKVGYEGVTTLGNIYTSVGDQADDLQKIIADIDWADPNAIDKINSAVEEQGIKIDTTSADWIAYTQAMAAAGKNMESVQYHFTSLREKITDVQSVLSDLEMGSIISDEDYQKLLAVNPAIEEFFGIAANGYKFLGDAGDLSTLLLGNTKQTLEDVKTEFSDLQNVGQMLMSDKYFDKNGNKLNKSLLELVSISGSLELSDYQDQILKYVGISKDELSEARHYLVAQHTGTLGRETTTEEYEANLAVVQQYYDGLKKIRDQYESGQFEDTQAEELWVSSMCSGIKELSEAYAKGSISAETYLKYQEQIVNADLEKIGDVKEALVSGEDLTVEQEAYLDTLEAQWDSLADIADRGSAEYLEALDTIEDAMHQIKIDALFREASEIKIDVNAEDEEFNKTLDKLMDVKREIYIEVLSDAEDTFKTIDAQLDKINAGAAAIGESYTLTRDQLHEVAEAYPGILENATVVEQGLIKLDKTAMISALERAQAEAMASAESSKAEIKSKLEALTAKKAANDVIIAGIKRVLGTETLAAEESSTIQADIASAITKAKAAESELQTLNTIEAANEEIDASNDTRTAETHNANETSRVWDEAFGQMTANAVEAANEMIKAANAVGAANANAAGQSFTAASTIEGNGYVGGHTEITSTDADKVQVPEEDEEGEENQEPTDEYQALMALLENYDSNADNEKLQSFLTSYETDNAALEETITSLMAQALDIDSNLAETQARIDAAKAGLGGSLDGKEEKKLETQELKKQSDQYADIDAQIESINAKLAEQKKITEHSEGEEKLASLKKEKELIEQLNGKYQEKLALANDILGATKSELQTLNSDLQFDSNNNVLNSVSVLNDLTQKINDAKIKFNNAASKAEQEVLAQEINALEQQYEILADAIEQYGTTLQLIRNIRAQLTDNNYELQGKLTVDEGGSKDGDAQQILEDMQKAYYDFIIKTFEAGEKFNEHQLKKIDYYLNKISDDFYSMGEAAGYMSQKSQNMVEQMKSYESLANELMAAKGQISTEDLIAGLEKAYEGIMSNLEAIQDLDKEMQHYYEDTLSAGAEELAVYTDHMEHLTSVLDHYQNIVTMMNGEMDFDNIGTILEGKASTLNNEMKVAESNYAMLKAEQAAMQAAYDAADAEGKKYLKSSLDAINAQVDEAHEAMLSKTEEWAEAQRAIMENSMKKAAHKMEMAFTNNMGFDALNSSMDRLSSYSDEYLTKTNQIYETQKLMNTAQQAIDKTTNQAAKVRLENYNKEIKQLQEKNKLSNLELDIAKAKYDVLLAEIALEEAQNAKATVRLQRDSEGNYGYVYTADKENIAKAEQDLADAQNALYNIGLEGANDYGSKLLDLQQQLADELIALEEARATGQYKTDEEYYAAKERLISEYNNLFEAYSTQYTTALEVDTAIQQEAWVNAYDEMILKTEDWQIHVDEYTVLCEESYSHWREIVQAESDIVTELLGNVSDAVKNITDESNNLKDKIVKEVIPEIENEYTQVRTAVLAYESLRAGLQLTITEYEELAEAIQKAMRQQALFEGQTNLPEDPDVPGEEEEVSPEEPDNKIGHSEMIDLVEDIMVHGSYENDPERTQKILDAGYTAADRAAAQQIINDIARNESAAWRTGKDWDKVLDEYTTKYGYNTGGYTGEWGPEGRLAVLHQKELILNASDTQNFLIATEILRSIADIIDINSLHSQISQLTPVGMTTSGQQTLEQAVSIEAHFPNVTDRNEIEEAFNNLINTASQYANRKF